MQPKPINGSRVLLFDRLVDENPGSKKERQPYRVHDRQGLMRSVQQELVRLLNTRRPENAMLDPSKMTVLDYGVPDFSSYSATSPSERQKLASLVVAAITAFEPRLQDVHIEFVESRKDHMSVDGIIQGTLRIGNLMEPVAFPVLLYKESGIVEILRPPEDKPEDTDRLKLLS